jgi:hypothetical protein
MADAQAMTEKNAAAAAAHRDCRYPLRNSTPTTQTQTLVATRGLQDQLRRHLKDAGHSDASYLATVALPRPLLHLLHTPHQAVVAPGAARIAREAAAPTLRPLPSL